MNPFLNAIQQGNSPEEILKYLSKALPKFSEPIRRASSMGYNAKQIIGYLSKTMAPRDLKGKSESEIHELNRMEDSQLAKQGLTMAATAAITPLAANAARNALQRALPASLQQLGNMSPSQPPTGSAQQATQPPTPQQTGQQTTPSNIPPTSQQPPLGNQVAPNISQPQPVAQPEGIVNPNEYLEKLGIKDKVDDLLKRGNSPEQTAAVLGMKSGMGKVRGEIDPELLANIDAYAKLPHSVPEEKIENVPIAKNETVATPHGVGEVKEIRNGKSIVEVNGKKHQVDEDELEASPIPEKDLADLYDELIQGIEHETGEDVSRMVQWAGYNPETNTLQFLPHTGKLYKYGNISPDDAALLTDILSTRKTSGENFIGAWKAGSKSPIGAALSKLIRKLQTERGGKGNEYEETHEPIYSAYEPAVQAAKKKKKKK